MFRRTAIIILSVYLSILVTAVAQTTSLECSDIGCAFSSSQSPQCWGQYNLSTNYYEEWPNTSVVREYFFDLVNTTAAPDGVERMVLTISTRGFHFFGSISYFSCGSMYRNGTKFN